MTTTVTPDYTLKQGTTPTLQMQLVDDAGKPLDLSANPTVTLELYSRGDLVVTGTMTIIPGNETLPQGSTLDNVRYTFTALNTATQNLYNGLARVVWGPGAGGTQVFPDAGYFTVEVTPYP